MAQIKDFISEQLATKPYEKGSLFLVLGILFLVGIILLDLDVDEDFGMRVFMYVIGALTFLALVFDLLKRLLYTTK